VGMYGEENVLALVVDDSYNLRQPGGVCSAPSQFLSNGEGTTKFLTGTVVRHTTE
jgi:hypothetical protein